MLFTYFFVMNSIAFITYGADKWLAIKDKSRIPEKTLLILAILGGTLGAYISMWMFRHKIRKYKFLFGIPLITLIQVVVFLMLYHS